MVKPSLGLSVYYLLFLQSQTYFLNLNFISVYQKYLVVGSRNNHNIALLYERSIEAANTS